MIEEFIMEILLPILIVLLMAFAICYPPLVCHSAARGFDDVNFEFFGGCLVKYEGKWYPLDIVRIEK